MSLCALTFYFNPGRSTIRRTNYTLFRAALEACSVPLVTVELAFGDDDFDLDDDAEVIRIRGGDMMFQKERLLSLGLQRIPGRYAFVAWLDCDVIFDNPEWVKDAVRLLSGSCVVLQPFDQAARLGSEGGIVKGLRSFASVYQEDKGLVVTGYGKHGHPGFAWAVRRPVLDSIGFYDAAVMGGGDHLMAHAFAGDSTSSCVRRGIATPGQYRYFSAWARPAFEAVQGRIGVVPGRVLHLWHGDGQERPSRRRLEELRTLAFDPYQHLARDESGCWCWSSSSGRMREWARRYFSLRQVESAPVLPAERYDKAAEMDISSERFDQFPCILEVRHDYVICSTQRSGSYLLCRQLINAGIGIPHEYFNPIHIALLRRRWGLNEANAGPQAYIRALRGRRTTPNGAWGTKLQWWQYVQRQRMLTKVLPDISHFIFLYRTDIARQAVSLHLALATGVWGFEGQQVLPAQTGIQLDDLDHVAACARTIMYENRQWSEFFSQHGITPLSIEYEQYAADQPGHLVRIAEFLELSPSEHVVPPAESQEQAGSSDTEEARQTLMRRIRARPGEWLACSNGLERL